jgi:hypothetical protein
MKDKLNAFAFGTAAAIVAAVAMLREPYGPEL